jgi:hypothetical protein
MEKRVIKIVKFFIISAASCICDLTITHIIAVSSNNRLVELGIVVQLPAGARDSFFPKTSIPLHSRLYGNFSVHFTCNIATCLDLFLIQDSLVFERHQP